MANNVVIELVVENKPAPVIDVKPIPLIPIELNVVIPGPPGTGIATIEKVETIGLVDFYAITYTDGTVVPYSITNGAPGAPGPPGEDGEDDAHYIHDQIMSSSNWSITHNLNKYPSVVVVDSAGSMVVGDITFITPNQITISFTGAFSGKAYLN